MSSHSYLSWCVVEGLPFPYTSLSLSLSDSLSRNGKKMTTTTTGGGGKSGTTAAAATTTASQECCMCGDFGLSHELFNCKVCLFRSQHRYCSNLYPKAESYQVCNWCLSQRDDRTEKTNSSNSTSSGRNNSSEDDQLIINNNKIKIKIKKNNSSSDHHNNHGGLKAHQYHHHKGTSQFQSSGPIKKQRSPERSPLVTVGAATVARKRVISGGGVEERLRRTKSEEMSNGGISKQVFRNKVRRYKLLDEVSSQ
ncbi:unnamed protein product [Camellia sinensis]